MRERSDKTIVDEMRFPRSPGYYELNPRGAVLVVSVRDPKLGCCGGWSEILYSRTEWDHKTKNQKALPPKV